MNKYYLETVEKLEKEFSNISEDDFFEKYKKIEIFIGDTESIKFIEEKMKLIKNKKG